MFKKKLAFLCCVMLLLSVAGYGICRMTDSKHTETQKKGPLLVTSFYPMYVLAKNLTLQTDELMVSNLTENQTGCLHNYQMTTKDMRLLSDADALLINGNGMELFVDRALEEVKGLPVITATEHLHLLEGSTHNHAHDEEDHEHAEDEHEHAEDEHAVNPHAWLDAVRYFEQAEHVYAELCVLFPEYKNSLEESYLEYKEKLHDVMEHQQMLAEKTEGVYVVIFHDAFAYLADGLHMNVLAAMALDEETVPSSGEIREAIEEINYHGGALIFIEEEYAVHAEKIVAETGAKVVYIDPLVTGDGNADSYVDGMLDNFKKIEDALSN